MRDFTLKVQLLHEAATAPAFKTAGAAAADLYACEDVVIAPGERLVVNTGIAVAIPGGYAGWVKSRSGLCREGKTVDGGLIDSDYRGAIGVQCVNACRAGAVIADGGEWTSTGWWRIKAGDRIAQLVLFPVACAQVEVVAELDETARGSGGFGSSGLRDGVKP